MLNWNIPREVKKEYPFTSEYFSFTEGHMHYVDIGPRHAPVVLMLHGNPTWSFMWRHLIGQLKNNYRLIAVDHLGMGLSSRCNDQEEYRLKNHIDRLEKFIEGLGINRFSLVAHDWGGAIGMGLATRRHPQVDAIALLNTAAYTSRYIPWQINLVKSFPNFGKNIVGLLNGFARPALRMASAKKLDRPTKAGLIYPYKHKKNRMAHYYFVDDIPMTTDHPSYATLKSIEDNLSLLSSRPIKFFWGDKDFCFNRYFVKRWQEIYPSKEFKFYPNAGHYVIEDARNEIIVDIQEFFNQSILSHLEQNNYQ